VKKGDLAALALPGAEIAVRVTPRASRAQVLAEDDALRVYVTEPTEDGRATDAVRRALAHALGVAPSRLTLVAGATARDKRFRLH
jgi:uncharacterized protein YggU (UPF0235/DUF167 family)